MKAIPDAFKERMKQILSKDDYRAFLKSYEVVPKKGIRTNRLKTTPEALKEKLPQSFEAEPVLWCEDGFAINQESRPGKRPEYYTGLYYPQEPSAMIPGEVLQVEPGEMVLDLCAAPGGKSTQVAAKMNNSGVLVLNEIVKNRVNVLSSNVERMGIKNAVILNENPANLVKNFRESFDKILVDAPCSGEGMFRKDPDVIDEWDQERNRSCSVKQGKILETVDELLKPGGEIVYSTCTFAPQENEEVIEQFLKNHDYELVETGLSGIGKAKLSNIDVDPIVLDKTVRLWPHLNEGEGHFVARLKKKGLPKTRRKRKKRNNNLRKAKAKDLKDFNIFKNQYMPYFDSDRLYIYKDRLIEMPEGLSPEDLTGLKVISAGRLIGEFKKNRFEPAHSLAMTLTKDEFDNSYELSEEELWDYLKGMEIRPQGELKNGWVLMCFEGFPVGFGKYSATIKNKYPKGLRIYKK